MLTSEQLAQSVRALRRRWRVVALLPLLAVVVSLGVTITSHKDYSATAKVELIPTDENQVSDLLNPGSRVAPADPEADQNTQVSQITETPMGNLVRSSLGAAESTRALLAQVSTNLEGTSNIVDITATDTNPNRAAQIANAFATQYVVFSLDGERSQLQQAVTLAQSRFAALTPAQQAAAAGQQLLTTEQSLRTDLDVLTSNAQVSESATVPSSPSSPRPLLDAVIALVVGLLIGIVAAIVLELFDQTIRDEDDAAAVSRLPILGVIARPRSHAMANPRGRSHESFGPQQAGTSSRVWTSSRASAAFSTDDWEVAESYRSLAVSLLSLRLGPEENVLMITSAGPQDGKTSVTLGLAAALSGLGYEVIAVECDLRRPRFAEYLGLPPSQEGLSSLLAGTSSAPAGLVDVAAGSHRPFAARRATHARGTKNVATTPVAGPHFTVLPCGPIPTKPLALLAGVELPPLLRQLRSMADVVLIDTPPLGVIKDAVFLTAMVDQVALVACIGHTRRDALTQCRVAITQLGSPLAGVVVVGGARGGPLSYYGRPDGKFPVGGAREATVVRTPERQLERRADPQQEPDAQHEPDPQDEPDLASEPEPQAEPQPTAGGKRSRSQRHSSDPKVG